MRLRLASVPPLAWVLLLTLVCLAPFSNKAFFVDDTLFLKAARHIQQHPGNFYGFNVNWFGTSQPMADVFFNPPLTSFYIALAASIVGWSEVGLHIAFLLPALAVAAGTFVLARHFCVNPLLAALLTIFNPAFLICATSTMADVLLLAFWVWALFFFLTGFQNKNLPRLLLAGLSAGLAFLAKLPGLALVPLMVAFAIACSFSTSVNLSTNLRLQTRGRRLSLSPSEGERAGLPRQSWTKAGVKGPFSRGGSWSQRAQELSSKLPRIWWIAPLLAFFFAVSYELLTNYLYGHGQFLGSASFASQTRAGVHAGALQRILLGLCFAGGCYLPVLFFSPWLWSRRMFLAFLIIFAVALLYHPHLDSFSRFSGLSLKWPTRFQNALFVMAAVHLLFLAAIELWERRDPLALLLFLWVFGVLVFAALVNWTITGRTLLPIAPAMGILLAARLAPIQSPHEPSPAPRRRRILPLPIGWGEGRLAAPKSDEGGGEGFISASGSSKLRSPWALLIPILLSLATSLLIVIADYNVANAERAAAKQLWADHHDTYRTVWFEGHWGFQYYMEQLGAKPLDLLHPEIAPQDILIIPNTSPNVSRPNPSVAKVVGSRSYLPNHFCSTVSPSLFACFYSASRGPLPFAFGKPAPDFYFVFQPQPQQ